MYLRMLALAALGLLIVRLLTRHNAATPAVRKDSLLQTEPNGRMRFGVRRRRRRSHAHD